MHDYRVLGGVLRSELAFPELAPARVGRPTWTLRVGAGDPSWTGAVPLGRYDNGGVVSRLFDVPGGVRLEFGESGWYDVAAGAGTITWYPGRDPIEFVVRWVVLGPVMALALQDSGVFCLHGGAVSVHGRAVALVAPKHYGKSTLALALVAAGARFLADDIVAVDPGDPPRVRPGIPSVRLWEESFQRVRSWNLASRWSDEGKYTVWLRERALAHLAVPLAAVYVVEPEDLTEDEAPARRERLPLVPAAIALVRNAKLVDPLIGAARSADQLRAAAELVRTTPVFRLSVARGFPHLERAAREIVGWHANRPAHAHAVLSR